MPCRTLNLKARSDRRFIRSPYRSNRFVVADITAPHAHTTAERKRAPVNLAFVLDRSGSMAGNKLRLAKLAVEQSVARLQSDDRFSIVVYDDQIEVARESALATPDNRRAALRRLAEIGARNSTNLGEGWLRGCEQVAAYMSEEGINRCLLLTDGLANKGITSTDELATHAAQLRKRGVSTTTFGVGADFDQVLLQAMATSGGGNFYYIGEEAQITDIITSEVGEALDVVARDVTLEVDAPEGVSVESLSMYPLEQSGSRAVVMLGALVAEQVVQVVLRLNFPFGEIGRETGVVLALTARDGVADGSSASLSWEYADGTTNDAQPRDVEVDRVVARIFAARARQQATAANSFGDFDAAAAALLGTAKRIRSYAGRDPEMREVLHELERDAKVVAGPMAAASIKEMHFQSFVSARMRAPDGKALRQPKRD